MVIAWICASTELSRRVSAPHGGLARKRSAPAFAVPGSSGAPTSHSVLISTYIVLEICLQLSFCMRSCLSIDRLQDGVRRHRIAPMQYSAGVISAEGHCPTIRLKRSVRSQRSEYACAHVPMHACIRACTHARMHQISVCA